MTIVSKLALLEKQKTLPIVHFQKVIDYTTITYKLDFIWQKGKRQRISKPQNLRINTEISSIYLFDYKL